jgi:hypothetical protein
MIDVEVSKNVGLGRMFRYCLGLPFQVLDLYRMSSLPNIG